MKKNILSIIDTFYGNVSGKSNKERNWTLIRSLFCDNAQLVSLNKSFVQNPDVIRADIESYLIKLKFYLQADDFYEYSVENNVKIFGDVALVFNVYEAKRSLTDKAIFKKGVNMIHLLKTDDDWKILSMIWHDISF